MKESASEIIWAFDLGKGSIGEAVRQGTTFLHKASLLIPAEFAETKTAANRRRAWRTRQAHKAREQWLDQIWAAAGLEVPQKRKAEYVDFQTKQGFKWVKGKKRTKTIKYGGKWKIVQKADYWLEREFAPAEFERDPKTGERKKINYPDGKADDAAPAAGEKDFSICYTSCLLRIKLLRGEKLEPWQIYKALHAAIQKRGYERVPWAAKEAARQGMTPEELEKKELGELAKKEPKYQATVTAWQNFQENILDKNGLSREQFAYPCYYDAWKMGLWKPSEPAKHDVPQLNHESESTRNIRFDRKDLEREIQLLVQNADKLLNGKLEQARGVLVSKFKKEKLERIKAINQRREEKNKSLPVQKQKKLVNQPKFEHLAESTDEFVLFGPAGKPPEETKTVFAKYLAFRRQAGLHPGSADDWMAATGQKVPRFDNRILEKCALIPRLSVCRAGAKPAIDGGDKPKVESLLPAEVAFLMKLKNIRVLRGEKVESLTPKQIQSLLKRKRDELSKLSLERDDPKYAEKVADIFEIGKNQWRAIGDEAEFQFLPYVRTRRNTL